MPIGTVITDAALRWAGAGTLGPCCGCGPLALLLLYPLWTGQRLGLWLAFVWTLLAVVQLTVSGPSDAVVRLPEPVVLGCLAAGLVLSAAIARELVVWRPRVPQDPPPG